MTQDDKFRPLYVRQLKNVLRNYAIHDSTPPFSAGFIPSSWNVALLARLMGALGPILAVMVPLRLISGTFQPGRRFREWTKAFVAES